jgi:hypothetical protein
MKRRSVARPDEFEDPRRRLLIQALAAGLLSAGPLGNLLAADIFGGRPRKLPPGQSIYRLKGSATVNDKEATSETRIAPGDTVRTGKDSELVFVVGDEAMLMRDDSHLVLAAEKASASPQQIAGLKLVKGRLLSVYAPGTKQLQTPAANIVIKGTGAYLESFPDETYFCTCYGLSEVTASDDPESRTTVAAKHHDRPLYILAGGESRGKSIRPAPFKNHSDQELEILETLVGRTPPWIFTGSQYDAPRLDY